MPGSGAGSLCRQSFPDMPPLPSQQTSMLPGELNLNQKIGNVGFGNNSISSLPSGFADFAGFANLPDPATFRAQLAPADAASVASGSETGSLGNNQQRILRERKRRAADRLLPAEVGQSLSLPMPSISKSASLNMSNLQIPGGMGNPFGAFFSNEPLGLAQTSMPIFNEAITDSKEKLTIEI